MGACNAWAGSLLINLAHTWDNSDMINRSNTGYDSKTSKDKTIDSKGQN